jgi:murein DD-endopeptidase MepM/ murein hydrolase activator NlpD
VYDGALRYSFLQYGGAPYVISLPCRNDFDITGKPRKKVKARKKIKTEEAELLCTEAERIAAYFLNRLQLAGGTPNNRPQAAVRATIERPAGNSRSFTFQSPGDLIERSGFKRSYDGNKDRTVYTAMRFPIAQVPAYANSQLFMSGGDCYGKAEKEDGDVFRCGPDGKQLTHNEGAEENFTYPWRNNFCEIRDWQVGQCPGGQGHQGQDIRPPPCKPPGTPCQPFLHDAIAVRDAYVLRSPGQLALQLLVNAPNERIRFRYLHMSPDEMDEAKLTTGKRVSEGQRLGKVGNILDRKSLTTYHLHFDIQVPTEDGWVWVNPYMTLVAAYERRLKAKGREVAATP